MNKTPKRVITAYHGWIWMGMVEGGWITWEIHHQPDGSRMAVMVRGGRA